MRDDTANHPGSHTRICPFIGAQGRAGTRLCHARPDDPIHINSRYVDEFCLSTEHKHCIIYLRADALLTTGESAEHRSSAVAAEPGPQSEQVLVPAVTSPPDGADVTASELVISGTGEPGYAVQLFRGDTLVAGTTVWSDGTWSIPLPLAAEGRHMFAVKGIDEAGRVSVRSPAITVTFTPSISVGPAHSDVTKDDVAPSPDSESPLRSNAIRRPSQHWIDRLSTSATALVCVLAVAAVLLVTLVIRPEMSWPLHSTSGSPPQPEATQRSAPVVAAEAPTLGSPAAGRGRSIASSSAHFSALGATRGAVLLAVSNPATSALEVTVNFSPGRGATPLHMDVPARGSGEVNLSVEAPHHATDALSIRAIGPFRARRWVQSGAQTAAVSSTPGPKPRLQLTPATQSQDTAVKVALQRSLRRSGFAGAVFIRRRGRVVLDQGYGFADRVRHVPIQPNTVFPIRGLTTSFTAVAILQLQDHHQLSVRDPICRYLAGCPPALHSITIDQLLTNTSGISNPRIDMSKPYSEAALMTALGPRPLLFTPGTRWRGSDTGYVLLGFIVEKVSGLPYQSYIHDHILVPAGMGHTGFVLDTRHPALAVGYHGSVVTTWLPGPDYAAAWGMYSTVNDLAAFDAALDRGTLLSPAATLTMFSTHVRFPSGVGYGYAWTTGTFRGQRFETTIADGSPGFTGVNVWLLGAHAKIIMLANQDRTSLLPLVTTLGNDLLNVH